MTDGETGCLVDNTVPAWRAALERLVGDDEYRVRLAAQSRRHLLAERVLRVNARQWQAAILSPERSQT